MVLKLPFVFVFFDFCYFYFYFLFLSLISVFYWFSVGFSCFLILLLHHFSVRKVKRVNNVYKLNKYQGFAKTERRWPLCWVYCAKWPWKWLGGGKRNEIVWHYTRFENRLKKKRTSKVESRNIGLWIKGNEKWKVESKPVDITKKKKITL